jgi:hypothetical protein
VPKTHRLRIPPQRHLDTLATKTDEKCGLVDCSR